MSPLSDAPRWLGQVSQKRVFLLIDRLIDFDVDEVRSHRGGLYRIPGLVETQSGISGGDAHWLWAADVGRSCEPAAISRRPSNQCSRHRSRKPMRPVAAATPAHQEAAMESFRDELSRSKGIVAAHVP